MKQQHIPAYNQPLVGRRVRLVRLHESHTDFLLSTFTNDDFWFAYRANQKRSFTREQLCKALQSEQDKSPAETGKIEWLIQLEKSSPKSTTPEFIGLASLSAYNVSQSRAEFLIGIFDKDRIRTGLGLEASLLVFDFAFNQQKLHKLSSFVYDYNESAQVSTLALGFRNEAILRKHVKTAANGDYCDVYQNGMLREEFRSSVRLSKLSQHLLNRDSTLKSHTEEPEGSLSVNASFKIGGNWIF